MFYFFSKVLLFLINPLCWLIFLTIYIAKTNSKKRKKIAFYLSLFIFFFMSNEMVMNAVMLKWETGKLKVDEIEHPYDYALVLSGNSTRINKAIEMFRKGKIKNICLLGRQKNANLKSRLLNLGIPEEHLFMELKSKNTYEHALFFEEFLSQVQPQAFDTSTFVMITSAYHIRRAKMCFEKQQIPVHPIGTSFISYNQRLHDIIDIIPSALTMYHWEKLIKEWIGIASYKVMGYI